MLQGLGDEVRTIRDERARELDYDIDATANRSQRNGKLAWPELLHARDANVGQMSRCGEQRFAPQLRAILGTDHHCFIAKMGRRGLALKAF